MTRAVLLVLLFVLCCASALAHKPSDSYLSLRIDGHEIQGQWDIALRDLEHAIGLDEDADGAITWGELHRRHEAIAAYALPRLHLAADDAPCPIQVHEQLVDHHSDGAYTVLRFVADCPHAPAVLTLNYALLFDLDALHRGLLRLDHDGWTETAVIGPDNTARRFALDAPRPWKALADYFTQGVWHIWIGFDHILFLVSLLLPSVLHWEGGDWRGAASFRAALLDVVKIVTGFTLAHSITLSLAVLGFVSLPSRLVESLIAASVLLVAVNNLYPLFPGRRAMVAFAFGLIHGLGFATVLIDLGLPAGALVPALVGFNLGVEAGQLAIVGVFLPLAFSVRDSRAYVQLGLRLGSVLIVLTASIWLAERSLKIQGLFS